MSAEPVSGPPSPLVSLIGGSTVMVRPISPSDVGALIEFHEQLSFDTVYRRYFNIHRHLTHAEAKHFCEVDRTDRLALVACRGTTIVGVARLERIEPVTTAEVAFVVSDAFHHEGIGQDLAQQLAAAARQLGVTDFVADSFSDNQPMLGLLPAAGFAVTITHLRGVAGLRCSIALAARSDLLDRDPQDNS